MAVDHDPLTRGAALGSRITIPRPLHRLERLRAWMEQESVDACVLFGAQNVAHLDGYARYYGGPAGLVVGRDGTRTLAVMMDEVPVATALGEADAVIPYGERGFGINLNPLPLLAAALARTPEVAHAPMVTTRRDDSRTCWIRRASSAVVIDPSTRDRS